MATTGPSSGVATRYPVVYVAGRFTAATRWEQESFIRAAEAVALTLAEEHIVPLCPHSMYRHFEGTLIVETWYAYTAELLRRCDGILMLENWPNSTGAQREAVLAEQLNLPRFITVGEAVAWFEHQGGVKI